MPSASCSAARFVTAACLTAGLSVGMAQCFPVQAQVVSDGSLGTNVQLNGQTFEIGGGTRAQGDLVNLFHSFSQFDVGAGQTAAFQGVETVDVIFARVTGGSASLINGVIDAGTSNLFFMNPDGIVFNNQAELRLNGSFFGVTADRISFFDGTEFNASPAGNSGLTGSVPRGFSFDGGNGDIVIRGAEDPRLFSTGIAVRERRTLALAGANVSISNVDFLGTPIGRVEVIAMGDQGAPEAELFVDPDDLIGISFGFGEFPQGNGQINITNSILVTNLENARSNQNVTPGSVTLPGDREKAGGLFLRAANRVNLQSSQLQAVTFVDGDAGFVLLQTNPSGNVYLSESTAFATVESGTGQGGFVVVDTGNLTLNNGSQLQSLVRGDATSNGASAGVVYVNATGDVMLTGRPNRLGFRPAIFSSVVGQSESDSGSVFIEARRVGVLNGSTINADNNGAGDPGLIYIEADLIAANRGIPLNLLLELTEGSTPNTGISAQSANGLGGLIFLDGQFLVLTNGSDVTTIANGGANTQDSDDVNGIALLIDFEVIASPSNDNNIVTDAVGDRQTVAGSVFFPAASADLAPPFLRNIAVRPQASPLTNDITVDGQQGALDGAIFGTYSEFSSFQPTAEPLPETVDPSRLIAQGCAAGGLAAAENVGDLTFTGREGLSATPEEQLSNLPTQPTTLASLNEIDITQADTQLTASDQNGFEGDHITAQATGTNTTENRAPIEAQTWRYGDEGQVILAAAPGTSSARSPLSSEFICNVY